MSGSRRYDAIVIGAGPNGLTAAITLARGGRSVLCVEAAATLGGSATTAELTLPGFHHDVFSAVHPAGIASPVFAELGLERHGLRWIQPELAMVHPLPDGRAAALSQDLAYTVALARRARRRRRATLASSSSPRTCATSRPSGRRCSPAFRPPPVRPRLLAGFKLQGTLEFVRLLLMSAEDLAGEVLHGDGAAWLYGSSLHGDAPLNGAGSAIAGVWLNVLGHAVGWPSPEGGAGRITAALASCLHELGGETRTSAPAERILAHRRHVTGVQLAGGERIAARTVIATTTPHVLVKLAGDALGDAYTRRALRFRYGPQTVKLDWALDGPIPWSNEDARRAGTVHVGGTVAQLRGALRDVARGELPEQPFLLSGQQTIADPTRAPAGKHTAWAYTHTPPGVDWSSELRGLRRHRRAPDRALRARLPRPRARAPRHGPARSRVPQREPAGRRRRPRQLRDGPAHLPPGAVAEPVQHAAARPVHRQRVDLPGRRRARRQRPRCRARGAA